jgi:hypothetical protein
MGWRSDLLAVERPVWAERARNARPGPDRRPRPRCQRRGEDAGAGWIPGGDLVLEDASVNAEGNEASRVHTPEAIAARLGGINIKTLTALIRNHRLETTTLGYAEPSRKGGPRRRLWGMTGPQLEALLALRNRRGSE